MKRSRTCMRGSKSVARCFLSFLLSVLVYDGSLFTCLLKEEHFFEWCEGLFFFVFEKKKKNSLALTKFYL